MYRACFHHLGKIERRRIAPTPEEDLRLHRLERPEPWEEELRDLMWSSLPANLSNFYPDYGGFVERLAAFAGVPAGRIVVGQGIESLVRDLVMLTCDPGDAVAFTHPTCAMFELYARVFGAEPVRIETDPDNPPGVAAVCAALVDDVRLLILPNPGQPVDACFGLDNLREIAERCRQIGAMLAIDEAYFGFGAPTALPLIEEFENVVVLRTFSKAFGGASLRVGYAMGSEAAIRPLDACRQSGEVSGPSMHAATVLMDHYESHVAPGVKAVCEGRDWLRSALETDGYKARGSVANHVLVDMGSAGRASEVAARLAACGVRVRVNSPPVDRWLMITCGSVPLMRRFHEAFREAA